MELSVCIDALYSGKDLRTSLQEIRQSGYNYFEFWSWWDKDLETLIKVKNELEMTITAFCTKFISLTDCSQRAAYIKGLEESVIIAKKLNCKQLITQVGQDTGEARSVQHQTLVEGLKACIPLLEAHDITLLIEPLNTKVDHKGYYLSSSKEAFEIIEEVGSGHVKVLFDIYHQQITEGDILRSITQHLDQIGHFHAAGNPGRHELYRGELNYEWLFNEIEHKGFKGFIGLEYSPVEEAKVGLETYKINRGEPYHK